MTFTVDHLSRPEGADKTSMRHVGTFDTYEVARRVFDRIVKRVAARIKKQYSKCDELVWHYEPGGEMKNVDFFQIWDKTYSHEYTTIETVMIEALP